MSNVRLRRQVQGSKLIDDDRKLKQLAGLLDANVHSVKLTALFNTSVDGWDPSKFHACCDNKGPTLTVVQGPGGSYYGGYTSLSWCQDNSYGSDPQAFLFRCQSPLSQSPEKFSRSGSGSETYNSSAYGPTFGCKFDFFTFDNGGDQILREQHNTGPPAYTLTGPLINSSAQKTQADYQLEVLQVGTLDTSTGELPDPWLAGVTWTQQSSRDLWRQVQEFNPEQEGAPLSKVNILLIGGVGAGKSSIVCSLDSLCKGRGSEKAQQGQGTGSLTRELRKYSFLNSETKSSIAFQLWDTMGWGVNDYKHKELEYILDGNLPDKCKLEMDISHKTPGFKLEPMLEDKVHCVCFVVPCQSATDDSYMQRLQELRDVVRSRNIRVRIIVTKIDAYDPDVIAEDVKKTYHSARLLTLMEDLEESSGVGGQQHIYPVLNVSKVSMISAEASILLCKALQGALYAAMDYLENDADTSGAQTRSTYTPQEDEQLAIANQDHTGQHGVLTLKKDEYYWMRPSATQGGWLLGHDGDGNSGRVLQRMVTFV